MRKLLHRPWARTCLLSTALCWLLSAFFRFALVGYGILALMFFCIGVVILLYFLFPRKLRIVLTVILVLGVVLFIAAEVPVIRASKGDLEAEADYLIVLGAGVNGAVPSLSMVNRLTAALDYLEAHPQCAAVLTGGKGPGEAVTEAEAMAAWLRERGIGPERLILEDRATNTRENIEFSLALIPGADTAVIAVCSSEYHLYRAEYIGRALGHGLYGVPARTTLPLLKLNYFIREALGVVHFTIFGI